eukprot:1157505-Pelagomonas_calceolata.AAC.6
MRPLIHFAPLLTRFANAAFTPPVVHHLERAKYTSVHARIHLCTRMGQTYTWGKPALGRAACQKPKPHPPIQYTLLTWTRAHIHTQARAHLRVCLLADSLAPHVIGFKGSTATEECRQPLADAIVACKGLHLGPPGFDILIGQSVLQCKSTEECRPSLTDAMVAYKGLHLGPSGFGCWCRIMGLQPRCDLRLTQTDATSSKWHPA